MIRIVYQSSPVGPAAARQPRDSEQALAWLDEGNRRFASLGAPDGQTSGETASSLVIDADFGFGTAPGLAPEQEPFGVVLGCADARVPVELVFGRAVNDLFVVRVAGNTIGSDGIGSIDYAIQHFPTVQVAVVLGHTGCGAVAAAVDGFLVPRIFLDLAASLPLRSLVDRILAGVRASAKALEEAHGRQVAEAPGYRSALLDLSVVTNAAYAAYSLRAELARSEAGSRLRVVFGVYDLATRRAGAAGEAPSRLGAPPADAEGFRSLAMSLATSPRTLELLARGGGHGVSHGSA